MDEDDKLMRQAYGHTIPNDTAYTAWIESDEFGDDIDITQARYGDEAAEVGRQALTDALGTDEAVEKVLARRGRPSLNNSHANGRSPHRQVRLGGDLDDAVTSYAEATGQSISSVIRQILQEWASGRTHPHTPG